MVVCVVPGCNVYHENNPNNYSFHRPPRDRQLLKKWLFMLDHPKWDSQYTYRICSKHFEPQCLRKAGRKRLLHPDSVPTLFMPVKFMYPSKSCLRQNISSKSSKESPVANISTSENDQTENMSSGSAGNLNDDEGPAPSTSVPNSTPQLEYRSTVPKEKKLNDKIQKLKDRLKKKDTLIRALRQHKKRNLKRIEEIENSQIKPTTGQSLSTKRKINSLVFALSRTRVEILSIKGQELDSNSEVEQTAPEFVALTKEELDDDLPEQRSVIYMKDNQVNELKCCRVCLVTTCALVPMSASDMSWYREMLSLPLSRDDRLPRTLCAECIALLHTSRQFRVDCREAYHTLMSVFRENKSSSFHVEDTNTTTGDVTHEDHSTEYLDDKKIEDDEFKVKKIKTENTFDTGDEIAPQQIDVEIEIIEDTPKIIVTTLKLPKVEKPMNVNSHINDHDYIKSEVITQNAGKKRKNAQQLSKNAQPMTKRPKGKYITNKGGVKPKRALKSPMYRDDSVIKEYFDVTKLSLEEQKEAWLRRSNTSNYRDSPFKCDHCFKGFLVEQTLQTHMFSHSEENGPNVCPICKKRFRNKGLCGNHHLKMHSEHYACKMCNFNCINGSLAKDHTDWHKGLMYECNQCGMTFSKKTSRMTHIRLKHPSDHVCSLCGYSFIGPKGLNFHKQIRHRGDNRQATDRSFVCTECDIVFVSEDALQTHFSVSLRHAVKEPMSNASPKIGVAAQSETALKNRNEHRMIYKRLSYKKKMQKGLKSIRCEECGIPLPTLSAHRTHYRNKHPNIERPIPGSEALCDICGQAFTSPGRLQQHKAKHSTGEGHKCATCNKILASRETLKRHERTHHLFSCHLCDKEYNMITRRDRHLIEIHKVVPDVKCYFCEETFKGTVNMKEHAMAVHSDRSRKIIDNALETFFCRTCNKEFTNRGNRDRHEKDVHKPANDVQCPICFKYLKSVPSMKLHVTHVHHKKPWPSRNRQSSQPNNSDDC